VAKVPLVTFLSFCVLIYNFLFLIYVLARRYCFSANTRNQPRISLNTGRRLKRAGSWYTAARRNAGSARKPPTPELLGSIFFPGYLFILF
jgi:hypothetical protein